jgi:hypothetical protein
MPPQTSPPALLLVHHAPCQPKLVQQLLGFAGSAGKGTDVPPLPAPLPQRERPLWSAACPCCCCGVSW